jgi:glycosyltransferase involved in cell wall biosynthesis
VPTALVAHPFADRYGSDRMVLESVRALTHRGWRVVVTVPEDGPLVGLVEEAGAQVALCPTPRLSKAALRPRGLVALAALTARGTRAGVALLRATVPDVVYVNTVTVPWWIVLARLRGTPVVCHVHEAERSASWLVRAALALPLLGAHRILANSRFAVRVATDSFPSLGRRTTLVDNGVVGPARRERARADLAGPVRLVYVGRLSARKGVDVAVRAVGLLRAQGLDVRLDLVGAVFPGYEWFAQELRELVHELGLDGQVRFLGFRDPVWPHLEAADIVLVPSRTDEPFGNTAVEALLAARPVVASGSGGLVEATSGYVAAVTVAPGSAAALAEGVARVVAEWPHLREAAWDDAGRAEERHAPERYQARVADVVAATAQGGEAR